MNLSEYFEQTKGRGVLATADAAGKVNAAIYVQSTPWATYLFMEEGEGYKGKRLYLKKVKEEQNDQLINEICQKCDYSHCHIGTRYVVHFTVEKVLPLIGDHDKA